MFEIRPTGGLCDRLVTIESFIAVTKQLNISDIKMIWLLNNELNCNFEEILQPISGIVVQNKLDISYKSDVLSRIKRKTISLFNNKILNKKHIDLYSLSVSDKYQYVISLLKSNKSRYSFSGLLLSEKTNDYFDCFFSDSRNNLDY
ncbi:MAG TPA: hypothetical protein GXZ87_11255 [Bacteroidales bacterium]|nr:hypothetical protein [Bacteroidales bacterium]